MQINSGIYPFVLLSLLFGASAGHAARPYSAATGGRVYAELPYTDDFGVPMIEVTVGGNTYRFILDTGASILCITDRVAEAENLAVKQSRYRFKNLQGRLKTTKIDSLTLGAVVMHRQEAVILPAGNTIFRALGVDGIIGGTVLEHFVVTFDPRAKTITLAEDAGNTEGWSRFKLWRNLPLFTVRLRGNAEEVYEEKMLFDSGNGTGTIVIPDVREFGEYIAKGMVSGSEEGVGVTSRMIGGLGKSSKLYRGRIGSLTLGGGTVRDIPAMTGGMAYPLLCWKITGLGMLSIDYPRKRYRFEAFEDAAPLPMTPYPVMTAVEKGRLIIASVWDSQLRRVISPGDVVEAIGGTPIRNPNDTATPNIDELIAKFTTPENRTVTIVDTAGVKHILPSELFIP